VQTISPNPTASTDRQQRGVPVRSTASVPTAEGRGGTRRRRMCALRVTASRSDAGRSRRPCIGYRQQACGQEYRRAQMLPMDDFVLDIEPSVAAGRGWSSMIFRRLCTARWRGIRQMKRILRLAASWADSQSETPRFVGVCEVRELLLQEPEHALAVDSIWRFMGRHRMTKTVCVPCHCLYSAPCWYSHCLNPDGGHERMR